MNDSNHKSYWMSTSQILKTAWFQMRIPFTEEQYFSVSGLVVVYLPDLSVRCEGGHGGALLCVVLRQAGAYLQHIGLPWLGNHHGVV